MSFKDQMFIVKSKLFSKRNKLLIAILTFLILVLQVCITTVYIMNYYTKTTNARNVGLRSLQVTAQNEDQDYSIIDDIEHVKVNVSSKYHSEMSTKAEAFNNKYKDGEIIIKPLLEKDTLKIVKGTTITSNNATICSETFYPYNIYYGENLTPRIFKKYVLNGDDIIGKEFTVANEDNPNEKVDFKIVGTYDNQNTVESINTCYIEPQIFETLKSDYNGSITTIDGDGNKTTEYIEYKGQLVIVDDIENMPIVMSELSKLDFDFYPITEYDEETLHLITYIPIFIIIITIFIIFNVIWNILAKKINYSKENFGVLKSCGYNKKQILNLTLIENIIITSISYLISLGLYLIIYTILKSTILSEFEYYNYNLPIPILLIVISFLFIQLLVFLINKHFINKVTKFTIKDLLVEE